jgi:hypothetical protein
MWVRAFFNSYKRRVIAAGGVIQNEPCAVRSLNNNLLRSASWTLVPSGIEEDVVFAQKPTSGLGDLTFTRASDATYTDAGGVVRRSPYNLLTFSEQFNDASWTKTALTISTSATANPVNGALTAQDAIPTAVSSAHRIFKLAGAESIANTWSIFAKAKGYNFITIVENGNTSASVSFNLSTGAVSTQISAVGQIQSLGNGWYRCSMVHTTALSPRFDVYISPTDSIAAYTGDGTSGVTLFGAQAVQGTSALDYFPTTNRQDVPRIDFRNADGTLNSCPRLLLEPQRTNTATKSDDFNGWSTKVNVTTTANYAVSPDGTQNADRLQFTAAGYLTSTPGYSQTSGTVYTLSCYAKRNGIGTESVGFFVNGSTIVNSAWTLTNEWQRLTYTYTASNTFLVGIAGANNADISVFGFQFEVGAYATTYIPTTTAAVTRITDAASKTGISSLIGQTEGVIFLDFVFRTPATATGGQISITDQSAPFDRVLIWNNFTLNTLAANLQASGSTIFSTSLGTFVDGQRYKIAIAYKSGSNAGYVNGTQIFTNTNTFTFASTMTDIFLGAYEAVGMAPHQLLNQAALFKTRLTNAQLAQLTT